MEVQGDWELWDCTQAAVPAEMAWVALAAWLCVLAEQWSRELQGAPS